jgi:glycosyltransferase involved in cell wall biosynthesis
MFKEKKALFAGFDNLTIGTPSQWLADRVKQSFLGDKAIRVVHNGIDTEQVFYPRKFDHLKEKHNITDEKIVLAVAPGLMEPGKGGRYVIALAEKMLQEKVKFILIGVDDPSEKFVDNVIVLGRTKDQIELAEYYSMANITILTSMKETFSLICAESLACGTPIAGFDSGAPKEVAPEGYGSFVAYGDADLLETTIRKALEHPEGYKSKGECVSFSQKHYAKQIMYANYLQLYLNECF